MKVNIDNIKKFKSNVSSVDDEFHQILFEGLKAYLGYSNDYSQVMILPGDIVSKTCTPQMLDLLIQFEVLKK